MLGSDRADIDSRDVGFVLVIVRIGTAVVRMCGMRGARVAVLIDMHVQAAELRSEEAQAGQDNQRGGHDPAHGESIDQPNAERAANPSKNPRPAGQAAVYMIGARAAPIRSPCSAVIIPPSAAWKRGCCTPETMYCQR